MTTLQRLNFAYALIADAGTSDPAGWLDKAILGLGAAEVENGKPRPRSRARLRKLRMDLDEANRRLRDMIREDKQLGSH
jgi:hypothetical protein